MIGATCVDDDRNDDRNDYWNRWWSMMMTRKNWKAQGELSVSCQSANICKGHDQGQTAPYTSSTMITIRNTTSMIEPVSYYCSFVASAMVWNVVVKFFVMVLVGCGNWSGCYCSSDFCARPILAADFFGDILCLLWCLHRFWFLAATPSVLFSLGGGPSNPGGVSHKTKRRNPTSALIRPTLTKLAHCDCTVKEGATHQDIFEGDIVVGELDKFLSCYGGVGSHLGFVNRYLHRKHLNN